MLFPGSEGNTSVTLVFVERKCARNEQYSRRECIEIVGIPCSITDDDLENEVVTILSDIDVNVTAESFQACHRLKKRTGL